VVRKGNDQSGVFNRGVAAHHGKKKKKVLQAKEREEAFNRAGGKGHICARAGKGEPKKVDGNFEKKKNSAVADGSFSCSEKRGGSLHSQG